MARALQYIVPVGTKCKGSLKKATAMDEKKASEDRQRLRSPIVYEIVRREGEEELARPVSSLWWSGCAAGVAISSSLLTEGILHYYLPDEPWRPAVQSLGYCVGFVIVILGRMELFTEHTVTAVLPLLKNFDRRHLWLTARLWAVVFAANLVGTFTTAAITILLGTAHPEHVSAMLEVAQQVAELTPPDALVYGIPAGFFIAAIAWMLPSAKGQELWVIVIVTYVIGVSGFAHVVVGSSKIFVLLLEGQLGLGHAFGGLIAPSLAGNILGGTGLFALLAYGQVHDEV